MIGEWVKWTKGLARKPKVIRLAEMLEMSRYEVAARLMEVWEWADDVTEDGNVPSVTVSFVKQLFDAPQLIDAMLEVGWLERYEDGESRGLRFPNFEDHNGQSAKRRALTAKRVKKHRSQNSADECNVNVTPDALPEKRREEGIDPPISPPQGRVDDAMFERFYSASPKKVAKPTALTAWRKAISQLSSERGLSKTDAADFLISTMTSYAVSAEGRSEFRVRPSRWLNEGRYDDDPAEWERESRNQQTSGESHTPQVATQDDAKNWRP